MALRTGGPIKILLIDDHTIVRIGIRMIIESREGYEVVGDVGSSVEALEIAARKQVDIILLDLNLGEESGLELIGQLTALQQSARVIVLTATANQSVLRSVVLAGARGLLHKGQTRDLLLRAIEKVHAGEVWLDRQMIAELIGELSGANRPAVDPEEVKIRSLTEREHEVVNLIFEGCSNRQIAQRLSISETTVRHHLSSVFSKLEVANRLALVVYAHRHKALLEHAASSGAHYGRK